MISNQILQSTLEGLKGIARVELCVGRIWMGMWRRPTSDSLDSCLPAVRAFIDSPADSRKCRGNQFFKIYDDQQLEYILVVGGTGSTWSERWRHFRCRICSLRTKPSNRVIFIKNLLLDNLLLVDASRAKKLHIPADADRVVLIIESGGGRDNNILEQMRPVFGNDRIGILLRQWMKIMSLW